MKLPGLSYGFDDHAPASRFLQGWPAALVVLASIFFGSGAIHVHADESPVDYLREIKPILRQRCYACHGALKQKSGLRLDTAAAILKGGRAGSVIEPGEPEVSLLIERVTASVEDRMPPVDEGTPLTPDEISLLSRWIAQGATGPADEQPQTDPRQWWSYRPMRRPEPPAVRHAAWVRNSIDRFVAAEQERHGLTPSPEASREIWLRRVGLDLIGLPPTRDELHAFVSDSSEGAYEQVVDRLLARPEYGERWGRHWMDVWRYSDWYGSRAINEIRYGQRHLWRWRDWIVESLNDDKPYDRMVVEMLAGDELAGDDPQVLRATGFIGRNWYKFDRNVWMFDVVEHTAQAFLGLTLRCARCHDHKYDPISQEDYYRFRAFFEPHDVRTDPLAAQTATEKDATLGEVLKDGVARVYDKQPEAPTYVFQRGDGRYPDQNRPVRPGVPAALGHDALDIREVRLPAEAYYPALQPFAREGLLAAARKRVAEGELAIAAARQQAGALEMKVAQHAAAGESNNAPAPAPAFHDDFSKPRPDAWKVLSGEWAYERGRLVEKTVAGFCTLVSQANHPRDFHARWKFRPLQEGTYRSIGFSFDYIDQGHSQDVYTHLQGESQGIQAFHRVGGQQVYPQAGIVKTTSLLKVGEDAEARIVVRGPNLTIWLNGQKQLDYVIPVPRREGKFALWVHQGTAEFAELEIREHLPTLADLQQEHRDAVAKIATEEQQRSTAQAELASLEARIAAEVARANGRPESEVAPLSLAASRAERSVAAAKAAEALLTARQHCQRVQDSLSKPGETDSQSAPPPALLTDALAKVAAAQDAQQAALAAIEQADGKYAPLGEQYPSTSTGRRLALARWIADPRHPRTARIAVNHMWLRHFGQALVPTVDNFGLNGQEPTHPELLDWLAEELVRHGWSMKRLHKLIVLSAAYRQQSNPGETSDPRRAADRDNRFLWRMNARRMEAEVVRDGVLFVAGTLDATPGGPELPEKEGESILRRSLYFRATPNEKMKFLELFDAADPNACYRRRESVVPQQALALMNSGLAIDQARLLSETLTSQTGDQNDAATSAAFIRAAFEQILSRGPTPAESAACQAFLESNTTTLRGTSDAPFPPGGLSKRAPSPVPHLRARENLVLVLFCQHEFVTIR
ncbi:MAG: DUF1553 domain-containing protein [Planctomycetales bacterium]